MIHRKFDLIFFLIGLTTWLCLAPRTALLTTFPWPFLVLILYKILETKDQSTSSKGEDRMNVKYSRLPGSVDYNNLDSTPKGDLTWRDKCAVAKQILPYIVFLFLTYFAEYLSNQGVITTIALSNSPFSPRDHYQYYIVCYHIGKFLGRSHIFFLSCTCSNAIPYVRVRKTWILALIEIAHLLFFVFASWFRFVPHVSIILILCFTEGFVAGSMYVNSAYTVSEVVSEPKQREFALGLLTLGNGLGKLTAGLLGLHVEPQLQYHCVNVLELQDDCITRYQRASGWTTNMYCTANHYNVTSSNSTVM